MRKIMMALAFAGIAMVSFAQEAVTSEVVVPTLKKSVITNSFWSNWFLSVNGGYQLFNGVKTNGESMFDHGTPAISAYVGKWHTPGFGWRVAYNGFQVKPLEDADKSSFYNVHADAMFNLSNLFFGYNEKRIWNFIPYMGLGYGANLDVDGVGGNGKKGSLTANAGLLNTFRIAKHWAINLELSATAACNGFGGIEAPRNGYDMIFAATAGVTYKFNKTGWQNTPDVDAITAANAAALAALAAQMQAKESENSQLKSQLAAAKAALAKCQNAPKDVDMFDAAQSVFFSINSSKIDSKKEILNLKSLAAAAKETGVKLTVTGYADSATGSATYNQTLSEARAKAVAAKLVEMGVPESQLIVSGKGGVDTEKPIQLNRRVIIAPAK
ncbi:MAG: OmpA family protein [Bacteroidaceae bacterium]|nr:OmpA family protein [Bacteroidaceae bacterium]MBQ3153373.1 OmpA family protein [Bacteroidaceae bacterium]MBQ4038158.1 OmpA family protein [Bacteroidaceae bacterium]